MIIKAQQYMAATSELDDPESYNGMFVGITFPTNYLKDRNAIVIGDQEIVTEKEGRVHYEDLDYTEEEINEEIDRILSKDEQMYSRIIGIDPREPGAREYMKKIHDNIARLVKEDKNIKFYWI